MRHLMMSYVTNKSAMNDHPPRSLALQLIGLVFIFIYALFGLQFFADRAQVLQ